MEQPSIASGMVSKSTSFQLNKSPNHSPRIATGIVSKSTSFQLNKSPNHIPRSQCWKTGSIRYSGSVVTTSSGVPSTGGSLVTSSAKQRMALRSPSYQSITSTQVDCTLLNANDRKVYSAPSTFMGSGGARSSDSTVPAGIESRCGVPVVKVCLTSPCVATPPLSTPPLSTPPLSSPRLSSPRPPTHSPRLSTPRPNTSSAPKLVSVFSDVANTAAHNNRVTVGRRIFEPKRKIGQGSFAVVWEVLECGSEMSFGDSDPARSRMTKPTGVPLALKCSTPHSQQMLEACVFEAEVLQQLAKLLQTDADAGQRVPRYVTHSQTCKLPAKTSGHGGTPKQSTSGAQDQVLLAMSKLDGKPLDQWLYGVDENRLKTLPMAKLLDGPLPGGQLGTRDLAGASSSVGSGIIQEVTGLRRPWGLL